MPKKTMKMKITKMIIGHLQCVIYNINLFMETFGVIPLMHC